VRTRRVEPLPPTDFARLAAAIAHGIVLAAVDERATADETAKAVDAAIRRAKDAGKALTPDQIEGLGVLWGKAVSQASGWTWARVVDGEASHVCLVAQDHAHACLPLALVAEQLADGKECTSLVIFEMIAGGALPAAELEELAFVG
jgi:hypothetical protein